MDHTEEHKAKEDNWDFYKEKVVDFLRITCGLESRFSEEEIFHVLGSLDVNSVRIHADNVQVYLLCYNTIRFYTAVNNKSDEKSSKL